MSSFQFEKYIGNCRTLLAKTIAIRKGLIEVIKAELHIIIIKSNSKITIIYNYRGDQTS